MKPDFSIIEPMACKCGSIEERNEILRQLDEWGVPKAYTLYPEDMLVEFSHVHVLDTWEDEDWMSYSSKLVYPSDFISKFREVYEASKEIVFPSDEECENIIKEQAKNGVFIPFKFIEWYKQRIQELNR